MGQTSKIPQNKWEVGHLQVADYCITISCAPASSDFSCFFKQLIQSSCYEPCPTPPPCSSTSHSLSWILAAFCQTVLQITLTKSTNLVFLLSLVFVCLICQAHNHLFILSFIQPSIRNLLRPTIY